jgi:hypothetical protein
MKPVLVSRVRKTPHYPFPFPTRHLKSRATGRGERQFPNPARATGTGTIRPGIPGVGATGGGP